MVSEAPKSLSVPSFSIAEAEKDGKNTGKDYHLGWYRYFVNNASFNMQALHDIKYAMDQVHGAVDPREYNHLLVSGTGVEYITDFIDFNEMMGFLEHMIGETHRRGSDITVNATSKNALSRKFDALLGIEVDYKMLPVLAKSQDISGLPFIRDDMPTNEMELEETKKNYKEKAEIIYQLVLDDILAREKFERIREATVEDGFLGRAFFRSILTPYGPRMEMLDNRTVIFDESCRDPWLGDAKFIGTLEYMPLTKVAELYKLTREQVKELEGKSGAKQSVFGSNHGLTYPTVYQDNGSRDFHVLVGRMEWMDIEFLAGVESTDKKGRVHAHIRPMYGVKSKERKQRQKAKVTPLPREMVRYAVVLGGDMCVEYGRLENQVRTTDDWQKSGFSIVGWLPRWKFGKNVSYAEQLIPLGKLKNEAMHKLRSHFQRDMGKFALIDQAQLPDGYKLQDMEYAARAIGLVPIQQKRFGVNSNYNMVQSVDLSMHKEVFIYFEIAKAVASEMERIIGMPPERYGGLSSPTQPVGNTELSIQQSTLRSERFYTGMDIFFEKCLTLVLGQAKYHIVENPDKYAHIIGEDGVEYIKNTIDFDLDDMGVVINTSFVSLEQKQAVYSMAEVALQQGAIDFLQAAQIRMESNPREALKSFEKYIALQKEEERRMMQQQMMQQQEAMVAQQQGEQAKRDHDMAIAELNANASLEKEGVRGQFELQKEEERGRALGEREQMKSGDARLNTILNHRAAMQKESSRPSRKAK